MVRESTVFPPLLSLTSAFPPPFLSWVGLCVYLQIRLISGVLGPLVSFGSSLSPGHGDPRFSGNIGFGQASITFCE